MDTRAIQKEKNVCAYSPRTCFVAADHWFLVFSVMLKTCIMQLYVGPFHVVNAEIAVAIISYSPDLAPSYFFLFRNMKEHLAVKRFTNDEDLKDAVVTCNNQVATWYEEGTHKLVPRNGKCLNAIGDYMER